MILRVSAEQTNVSKPFSVPFAMTTGTAQSLCPDLLRYEQIGEADRWRGRVVRAFFWIMRWWP
jgi:hypothetical protein